MRRIFRFSLVGLLASAAMAMPASAQDAAESAAILSGTGARTGSAARQLGSASRDALGGAANAIAAVNAQRSGGASGRRSRRSSGGGSSSGSAVSPLYVAGDIDALQFTSAPYFRLVNGSTLRMSGSFAPSPGTVCERYCGS